MNIQTLLSKGFLPKDATDKKVKKEIIHFLESEGMDFMEATELLMDFQWYQATEADYELTRKINENNARKEQFNQFLQ